MQSGIEEMKNNSMFRLEEKLNTMLKPVKPDPVFMNTLKTKLANTPTTIIESSKKNLGLAVFGVGLFAGALIFWLVDRLSKGNGKSG